MTDNGLVQPPSPKDAVVVFVSGNFNVLHVGHQRLFETACNLGGRLVVGLIADSIAGDGAYVPQADRLKGLKNNTLISEVRLITDSVSAEIMRLKPDFVVKGREHERGYNPELEALKTCGGKLLFSSGTPFHQTRGLIERNSRDELANINFKQLGFIKRHSISFEAMRAHLKSFHKMKVCIIGDIIIDEYVDCIALGMSQEDHNIVLSPTTNHRFLGGAGILARNAVNFGANVTILGVVGDDELGRYAIETLVNDGAQTELVVDKHRPTTLKQRFKIGTETKARISHLSQIPISSELESQLIDYFDANMSDANLLIFSDFNYGLLTKRLIKHVSETVKRNGGTLAADSQSSSQVGDIGRYIDMDLITPTEREARLGVRNFKDGLVEVAEVLRKETSAKNIIMSVGADGMLIHNQDQTSKLVITDRLPALNKAPRDASGAGDAALITSAMAIAAGANIWEAGIFGSVAASIQVSRVGNQPILMEELLEALQK